MSGSKISKSLCNNEMRQKMLWSDFTVSSSSVRPWWAAVLSLAPTSTNYLIISAEGCQQLHALHFQALYPDKSKQACKQSSLVSSSAGHWPGGQAPLRKCLSTAGQDRPLTHTRTHTFSPTELGRGIGKLRSSEVRHKEATGRAREHNR